MILSIYIPQKMEEKCKIVLKHCRKTNDTLSKRVQKIVNKIYNSEIENIKEE